MAADAEEEEIVDTNDPDYIAANAPAKVVDGKTYFQTGAHEGKWSEYDDRGVPSKNIKKKKPTKKEKEQLETEYIDAQNAYQKYLKEVEKWEQAKLDAEKSLKKNDRLRWAFRQIGEKLEPIDADDMETLVKLMGWKNMSSKEIKIIQTGVCEFSNLDGRIELERLRAYMKETMPVQLLEERFFSDRIESFPLDRVYSPRTWRKKIEDDPPPMSRRQMSPRSPGRKTTKKKTLKKGDLDDPVSPRRKEKKRTMGVGEASPRGGAVSPRSSARRATTQSPRTAGKKDTLPSPRTLAKSRSST